MSLSASTALGNVDADINIGIGVARH